MFGIGTTEFMVILAVALVIFGPQKLPELAKAIGRAVGEFKKATTEIKETFEQDDQLTDVKRTFEEAVAEGMRDGYEQETKKEAVDNDVLEEMLAHREELDKADSRREPAIEDSYFSDESRTEPTQTETAETETAETETAETDLDRAVAETAAQAEAGEPSSDKAAEDDQEPEKQA